MPGPKGSPFFALRSKISMLSRRTAYSTADDWGEHACEKSLDAGMDLQKGLGKGEGESLLPKRGGKRPMPSKISMGGIIRSRSKLFTPRPTRQGVVVESRA